MDVDPAVFLPDALVMGISEIDGQHGTLFAQLEDIKAVCLEKNYLPPPLGKALQATLEEHFATEQRYAEAAGIYFAEHGRAHQKMLAAIDKAVASVNDGSQDIFSVLRFVEYWFERHISEYDLPLGQRVLETTMPEAERSSTRGYSVPAPHASAASERSLRQF